jgi:hypothetical protein
MKSSVLLVLSRTFWCVCVAACLFLSQAEASGGGGPKEDSGLWTGAFFEAPIHAISPNFVFYLDSQWRFDRGATHFSQALFRPAVGYLLPYGFGVFLGYAIFGNSIAQEESLEIEHRIWQQLNWKWKFKRIALELYSRTRFEQRFLSNNADVSWRIRQYSRVSWMFHPKSPVGIGLGSEMFFALNAVSWSQSVGFTQHRAIAAFLIQLHKNVRPEIGYMNQIFVGQRMVHVGFVRFFMTFE